MRRLKSKSIYIYHTPSTIEAYRSILAITNNHPEIDYTTLYRALKKDNIYEFGSSYIKTIPFYV